MKQRFAAEATAAPQHVWDILVDGRHWPQWNDRFEWAWVEGAVTAGTFFTVKKRGGRQTALRIEEAIPPRLFTLALSFGPTVTMRVRVTITPTSERTSAIAAEYDVSGLLEAFALKMGARRVGERVAGDVAKLAAYAGSAQPEKKDTRP